MKRKVIETWKTSDGTWTWEVLSKNNFKDDKPNKYARWFCNVVSPMCPNGEMGDVYREEIKNSATKVL